MKFSSQKDLLPSILVFSYCAFTLGMPIFWFFTGELTPDEYWAFPIILLLAGIVLWVYFGTWYELNEKHLIYRHGPVHRKIALSRIREIKKGSKVRIGFRPISAMKSLTIKFDQYNELYISPKASDTFVERIVELKSDIVIS